MDASRSRRSAWLTAVGMILCLTAAALASACGNERDFLSMSDETRSDRKRAAPTAGVADLEVLVDGNSAFAFDLFHALRAQDGNLFFSPHSISTALAMTYAGAKDQTASQMADTLRFSLPQDRLHPAFNGLAHELASRSTDALVREGEGFRLNIVNAVCSRMALSALT